MNHTLAFNWRNEPCNDRVERAQQELFVSCIKYHIKPIICVSDDLPKFGDILSMARKRASPDGWMGYVNSDCVLIDDPWKSITQRVAYGFRRIEKPSGGICSGVDMYILPVEIWDQYLSQDLPDMYIGVTHVDWWLTRACQKIGKYTETDGAITHESHPKVSGATHPKARYNLDAYHSWACRNNISVYCANPCVECKRSLRCNGSCGNSCVPPLK